MPWSYFTLLRYRISLKNTCLNNFSDRKHPFHVNKATHVMCWIWGIQQQDREPFPCQLAGSWGWCHGSSPRKWGTHCSNPPSTAFCLPYLLPPQEKKLIFPIYFWSEHRQNYVFTKNIAHNRNDESPLYSEGLSSWFGKKENILKVNRGSRSSVNVGVWDWAESNKEREGGGGHTSEIAFTTAVENKQLGTCYVKLKTFTLLCATGTETG